MNPLAETHKQGLRQIASLFAERMNEDDTNVGYCSTDYVALIGFWADEPLSEKQIIERLFNSAINRLINSDTLSLAEMKKIIDRSLLSQEPLIKALFAEGYGAD